MTNLWSGRFDTAPDAAAFEFGASFRFDRRLFEDDVTGSIAWGRALRKAGVLTPEDAAGIDATLTALLDQARSDPAFVSGDDEDVHSFVERQLVERVGDAGRRLHTGRSRNEQVSLDLRLYLRRRIPLLQRLVASLVEALAAQAASAGDAPRRQSPGTYSTLNPIFSAIPTQMFENCPVSNISTRSPGESVFTSAASHAPVPDEG